MIDFLSLRFRGESIVPYARAWEFQKELLEKRVRGEIPDTYLFVEHPPTVTRGRGLQRKSGGNSGGKLGSGDEPRAAPLGPLPSGTEYFEVERGGDLTWHGPGQLVVYPIVKIDDVGEFLRRLESSFGKWLARYGLSTESREGATGIWVCSKDRPDRKIASIGIAVRKWVTYHGIGLNLANSLDGFYAISPCGFDPGVMTTLAGESPAFAKREWSREVRAQVEHEIVGEISPGAEVSVLDIAKSNLG